jgi:CRISPR/Cas system-associated exonuclease Cas4 (RecB family)
MNERAFSYNQKPFHSHRCQLNLYLRSERAKFGYIIYINKSDMSLHTFRVDYDENLFHQSLANMRQLLSSLRTSSLPPKPKLENWECSYCIFQEECAKNDNPALHARLFPISQNSVQQAVIDS